LYRISATGTSSSDHNREVDALSSNHYRVAAFDVTGRKISATPSVVFHFVCKNAGQESSKLYSDLRTKKKLET